MLFGKAVFFALVSVGVLGSEPPLPPHYLHKIAAHGDKHFCFPGLGCNHQLRHDDCDTHCRNHTFQIGGCVKVLQASGAGSFQNDYNCCCYGSAPGKDL